jgi:hypothetical protein
MIVGRCSFGRNENLGAGGILGALPFRSRASITTTILSGCYASRRRGGLEPSSAPRAASEQKKRTPGFWRPSARNEASKRRNGYSVTLLFRGAPVRGTSWGEAGRPAPPHPFGFPRPPDPHSTPTLTLRLRPCPTLSESTGTATHVPVSWRPELAEYNPFSKNGLRGSTPRSLGEREAADWPLPLRWPRAPGLQWVT